jgi:hypothetical protein
MVRLSLSTDFGNPKSATGGRSYSQAGDIGVASVMPPAGGLTFATGRRRAGRHGFGGRIDSSRPANKAPFGYLDGVALLVVGGNELVDEPFGENPPRSVCADVALVSFMAACA